MGAKSVTVFLDAASLVRHAARNAYRKCKADCDASISSCSFECNSNICGIRFSDWQCEEKEHGLFTYHVLKGLGGEADLNEDTFETNELSEYVSTNVREQAAINGREQTPELQGDADRVLVRFE